MAQRRPGLLLWRVGDVPAPSTAVANRLLELAVAGGRSLTNMQLQKLVYIAHGWTLALTEESLTTDEPEAWDYGPVYKDLYRSLRQYGSGQVERKIKYDDYMYFHDHGSQDVTATFSSDEEQIISAVWNTYGHFPAFQLSALTHQEGTPWSRTYKPGSSAEIPANDIREHFQQLARERTTTEGSQAATA